MYYIYEIHTYIQCATKTWRPNQSEPHLILVDIFINRLCSYILYSLIGTADRSFRTKIVLLPSQNVFLSSPGANSEDHIARPPPPPNKGLSRT